MIEGNGLAFYGLAEIRDPKKRVNHAAYLTEDLRLIFPDLEVCALVPKMLTAKVQK
jgi:hypothetical protein